MENRRYVLLRSILVLPALVASLIILQAENNQCLIHLDKSFYVCGEYIWYHVYLPTSFKGRKATIRVTLHDEQGVEISHHYHDSEGSAGFSGYYKIPFDQFTGVYVLAFSTYATQSKRVRVIGSVEIPIYNDLEPIDGPAVSDVRVEVSAPSDLKVSMTMANGIVEPRDLVNLNIQVTDRSDQPVEAILSLAVIDPDVISSTQPSIAYGEPFDLHPLEVLDSTLFYVGTLTDRHGVALQANVLGAYVGNDRRLYYTKSDEEGHFVLRTPNFHDQKFVQFLGYYKEDLDIHAELDGLNLRPQSKTILYTDDILDYIELSRLRKKIYQLYTTLETHIILPDRSSDAQILDPDLTYRIEEYENFDDIRAFFGELVTPLTFKVSQDSIYSAVIYNTKARGVRNTFLSGTPLFIIDDKVTHDADFVARMSLDAVETIELFVDPQKLRRTFQAIGMSGVVRIRTQLKDAPMPIESDEDRYEINGYQEQVVLASEDLSDGEKNQPVFRPLVHWISGHTTDQQGSSDIQFRHSDDLGVFQIQVVVQSLDGARGAGIFEYTVPPRN
ncbi:MAG: hypothetical protein OEQ53_03855 [Saprospiraceae bacterium]|nr:hypothetical protein [Saprospiraceae bacterium]